ncbi:MAG: alpha/beta hydrolase [Chloroflexi bacterium]|nr:alpha/beta hydrolase [Chloroflexota bacterium]
MAKAHVNKRMLVRSGSIKYQFANHNFDFWFQWLVGFQTNGGSESGECFYTASRIKDGDPESWVKEWSELGGRTEQRAATTLTKGHTVSAREAFLRAYSYYRFARLYMSIHDPAYKSLWQKSIRCFHEGTKRLDPPVESIAIPFEGKTLPAYFLKPGNPLEKHKTLIMIGGGDTFVEDLYFYIGPAALKRDYNVLMVDLPGQGGLPFDGMPMRPDAEAPMKAVVDYALSRPEVDPHRLAAYGISGGGYLVPRAATREPRLKACVASSAIPDFYEYMTQGDPKAEGNAKKLETPLYRLLIKLMGRRVRAQLILIETYLWRWGVKTAPDWLRALKTFTFDPREIRCPLLLLIGESEYEKAPVSKAHQHQCIEQAAHPKKDLIIGSYSDGAWGHALGTNLSLMSQWVFDWLDEVFEQTAENSSAEPALMERF